MILIEDLRNDLIDYANAEEQKWWQESGRQRRENWEKEQREKTGPRPFYSSIYQPQKKPHTFSTLDNTSMRWVENVISSKEEVTLPSGRKVVNVDEVGGENCGPIYSIIFSVDGELFELTGSYTSEDGVDWYYPELDHVRAVQKTITVYERV